MIKKVLLSGLVIILFVFYSYFEKFGSSKAAIVLSQTPSIQSLPSAKPTLKATQTPSLKPISPQISLYKDGSFTGSSVDVYYGNVQIKATVNDGKISNIEFLDYPRDRKTSEHISQQV